jgi:predicted amidohydrolase YtcJ
MSDTESSAKNEGLLTSVAESIGSALGNLAEKASAAQKSIGKSTARIVDSVTHSKRKSTASKRKTTASKRKPAPKKKAKVSAKKSTASRTAKSKRPAPKST